MTLLVDVRQRYCIFYLLHDSARFLQHLTKSVYPSFQSMEYVYVHTSASIKIVLPASCGVDLTASWQEVHVDPRPA